MTMAVDRKRNTNTNTMIESSGISTEPLTVENGSDYRDKRVELNNRGKGVLRTQSFEVTRKRRPVRRRKRKPLANDLVDRTDRSSILFYLLLLGLLICLSDVLYVVVYVDNLFHVQNIVHLGQNTVVETTEQQVAEANSVQQKEPEQNKDDPRHDKERILQMLEEAGMGNVDDETIRKLPTWSKVLELYGDHPRIYGLEQCEVFRKRSDPADHFLSVAGAFNSGTNLMSELLIHNCHMPDRMKKYGARNRGIRWQVPWGKHNPPSDEAYRQSHKTLKDADVDANNVFPAVTIRDPYVWMSSMCRHHYEAHWRHSDRHCPNLVPDMMDKASFPGLIGKESVPVDVRYGGFHTHHESLAHMWNDWYNEYVHADFPRIIVRMEDLVFYAKEVTETVCQCAGGAMDPRGFNYVVDSAKKGPNAHGAMADRTSLVDAMIRYGTDKKRFDGFKKEDLLFANMTLNRDLLEFFGYSDPPARLVE